MSHSLKKMNTHLRGLQKRPGTNKKGPTLRRSNREGVRDCRPGVKAGLAPRRLEDIQAQAKAKKDKISAEHAAKETRQAAERAAHLKNVHKVAQMLDRSAREEKEAATSFDRYPGDESDSDTDMPDGAVLVRDLQERRSQPEHEPDDVQDQNVGAWHLSDAPDAAPENFEQQARLQEVPAHDFVSDTTQEEHGRLRGDGAEEREGSENGHGEEEGVFKDPGADLWGGEQQANGDLSVGLNDGSKKLTACPTKRLVLQKSTRASLDAHRKTSQPAHTTGQRTAGSPGDVGSPALSLRKSPDSTTVNGPHSDAFTEDWRRQLRQKAATPVHSREPTTPQQTKTPLSLKKSKPWAPHKKKGSPVPAHMIPSTSCYPGGDWQTQSSAPRFSCLGLNAEGVILPVSTREACHRSTASTLSHALPAKPSDALSPHSRPGSSSSRSSTRCIYVHVHSFLRLPLALLPLNAEGVILPVSTREARHRSTASTLSHALPAKPSDALSPHSRPGSSSSRSSTVRHASSNRMSIASTSTFTPSSVSHSHSSHSLSSYSDALTDTSIGTQAQLAVDDPDRQWEDQDSDFEPEGGLTADDIQADRNTVLGAKRQHRGHYLHARDVRLTLHHVVEASRLLCTPEPRHQ
ncbi:hypothetical protein L227DRAFT_568648 [Lentinus tigrinus ALCF2SS1-6]|uniref:Uncharacterized protein n=1 Tax=Lentinus tigrinus ALCF2SS1-6 TaxID=1328759 RepID=A0A5C2RMM0_9APHY|nr:hypothetical protein L227DRAFT_568648 [Lentinus tigrinus ALCF2SS1-6]